MLDLRMKHFGVRGRALFFSAAISLAGLATLTGCKKAVDGTQMVDNSGMDPADVNQAPVDPNQPLAYPVAQPATRQPTRTTRVLGQSQTGQPQQAAESYQQAAPIERAPDPQNYRPPYTPSQQDQNNSPAYRQGDENFDQTIDQYAEQAREPPPPLPAYEQPPCPEPNYLWTPGYWSWAPAGYFWVPGAWAAPPYYRALWTPGYWGEYGNAYRFHRGFWGLHIGFYGGISYGFGYTGSGYHGGYWNGNNFYYNRAVNRVNETVIHNTYVRNVTINNTVVNNRVSYNGGRGGIQARPAAFEVAAMHEQHAPPMAAQVQLREQAQQNRQQFYSANQGRPAAVVAPRPLVADRGIAAPPRPLIRPGVRPEQPSNTRPAEALAGREPQRGIQPAAQQHDQFQQRNEQEQQRGLKMQEQQRQQAQQQRDQQQRTQQEQQLQQRNDEQRDQQLQQQRNQLQQQRNDQVRNQQLQQQQNQQQQRNDLQRSQQLQQQQNQLRGEQERGQQRMQPHPQPNEQRPQPQAPPPQQPRAEPQRPAAQPQPQPQPRAEASRPAPQPHPQGERRPPL